MCFFIYDSWRGGAGCVENWKLVACTECTPSGIMECTYEDIGTCDKGIKVVTESCVYTKPIAQAPAEQVYVPSRAEVPKQPVAKPSMLPYLIGGTAGLLAILLIALAYYMRRKKK